MPNPPESWDPELVESTFALVPRMLESGGWVWLRRVYYKTHPLYDVNFFGIMLTPKFYYSAPEVLMMKLRGK